MTVKEKAEELITKMQIVHIVKFSKEGKGIPVSMYPDQVIQCAVIAVEEIIEALYSFCYSGAMYDCFYTGRIETTEGKLPTNFWYEVLTELKEMQ